MTEESSHIIIIGPRLDELHSENVAEWRRIANKESEEAWVILPFYWQNTLKTALKRRNLT